VLLEFSLGKLACEVDQWNRRPPSWRRGISLSPDLTQLTRVHRANLIRQGYRPIYVEQSMYDGTGDIRGRRFHSSR
jgi:hypothetical protein